MTPACLSYNRSGGRASGGFDRPVVRPATLAGAAVIRPGWGVRSYLLAVVLSSLLPLAVFAGYLSYDSAQGQLATIRTSIISTTRALAVAVDEHIGVRRDMLQELARSERLRAGDLPGFHAEMVNLSRLLGGTIITLVRPDGTRALLSSLPADAVVPGVSNADVVRRVFETGQAQVSDVFVGAITQVPLAVIAVPVKIGDAVAYSLNLTLNADDFIRLLSAQHLPDAWLSGIVDQHGRFLARRAGQRGTGRSAGLGGLAGRDPRRTGRELGPLRRAGRTGGWTMDTRGRADRASSSASAFLPRSSTDRCTGRCGIC